MYISSSQAATYSGDPGTSKKDEVRFLIGDVEDDYILSDTEIQWFIDQYGSRPILLAAASAAEAAGARYIRTINRSVGTQDLSMVPNPYAERAAQLRRVYEDTIEGTVGPVPANIGFASVTAAMRPPLFWLGQFDLPPTGPGDIPIGPP